MDDVTVRYEVEYTFYQHNSGAGDNGEYRRRVTRPSAEAAVALAASINRMAADREGGRSEDEREIMRDLISWSGYFLGARAYHVASTPISPMPTVAGR